MRSGRAPAPLSRGVHLALAVCLVALTSCTQPVAPEPPAEQARADETNRIEPAESEDATATTGSNHVPAPKVAADKATRPTAPTPKASRRRGSTDPEGHDEFYVVPPEELERRKQAAAQREAIDQAARVERDKAAAREREAARVQHDKDDARASETARLEAEKQHARDAARRELELDAAEEKARRDAVKPRERDAGKFEDIKHDPPEVARVEEPVAAKPAELHDARSDDERLQALVKERGSSDGDASYRIGTDDLLEINVFGLPDMSRKARVGTNGAIEMPLIGSVRASGMSASELSHDIANRLRKGEYVTDPQVDVLIDEYRSRQVSVTGSVAKPGLYPLTKSRYTIVDMLSEAGGLTKEAGGVIEFLPAEAGGSDLAAVQPLAGVDASDLGERAITIDLSDLLRGKKGSLRLPLTAGDVIYVPEAGSFTIEGWVDKPGTYPITRKATVLAALSAGGGPLMPASLSRVELLRSNGESGDRTSQRVDLVAIRNGQAKDVELRSGDIVRVPGNVILMVPWSFYSVIKGVVSVGAALPVL